MVSPMRNDPHERLEQATQGPEPQQPPIPSTQGPRQRPSPKQPPTKRGAQSPYKSPTPHTTMKQAHMGTPEHHKKQKEGTKTPPAAHAPPTESFAHINTHRVNPPPSPQRLQQPPHPSHPIPRYPTHPSSLVASTQETAHSPFHTEPPQYPISGVMQRMPPLENPAAAPPPLENPAAGRGRRFDPHSEPTIHLGYQPPERPTQYSSWTASRQANWRRKIEKRRE